MAFQRPFLISLKRGDSSNRWGFGIQGGKDYCEPLRVQSVIDDSLAEKYGLREGDEIIQVGRVNVQDMTLGQVHELLARCGNKIEMFVVREDLLSPRKGKEPPVVKAVVHNPYNSPLSLYSTENIAETLAKQTEVLTEGQLSNEEDEGPENLSFKEKSAVFKLLEEQAKQEGVPYEKPVQRTVQVVKPKTAPPPPPPKPKPPSNEQFYNGYDSHQQVYQDQQKSGRVEYQTTQKVVNQYQYQQEQPTQYQKTTVYQTSSHQNTPGYHSPLRENFQEPGYQTSYSSYQQYQSQPPPSTNYQQTYQQSNYQIQSQGYQSPVISSKQQHPGYQSPSATTYQQLNQINYQQNQNRPQSQQIPQQQSNYQQSQQSSRQQTSYQQSQQPTQQQINYQQTQQTNYQQPPLQQTNYQQTQQSSRQQTNYQQNQQPTQQQTVHQQQKAPPSPSVTSKAEFKIGPPPPPRSTSTKQDTSNMTAIYKQQYEQHLQKQYEQQILMNNNIDDESSVRKAHIINGDIFEHNSTSGTPITYKAPPAAPPKPNWPPPAQQEEHLRSPLPDSPRGNQNVATAWPPKKSSAVELPKTGFNPAAVREQGTGRRCVWPPPADEFRSGRNTPQSPLTGRRIQWNPSPSPPTTRKAVFSSSQSPCRRKDINWPPPSAATVVNGKENLPLASPRMSRKARFDDYIHEHASINVPQTYRPPPGTQHIEYH